MPKGVYQRTKTPYNKGVTKYRDLILRINWLLVISGPLTIGELHANFSSEVNYKTFQWLTSRARNGCQHPQIVNGLIKDGRGLKNKGRHNGRPSKFKVGDRVRLIRVNKRTPQWLREEIRIDALRTITAVFSNSRMCTYYLGSNSIGSNPLASHGFRANELELWIPGQKVGRPRAKRAYNRKNGDMGTQVLVWQDKGLLVDLVLSPSISCVNECKAVAV